MIGYVTLGTNDLPRAAAFCYNLLAEIGGNTRPCTPVCFKGKSNMGSSPDLVRGVHAAFAGNAVHLHPLQA